MLRSDAYWMGLAMDLASRGRGRVEPNPMVGCVIVENNELVASGYHHFFGGPHAEVVAFDQASRSATQFEWANATVYVTLEPCSHHGKTPPCVDLILSKRPKRVVIAMTDPFPQVAGRGIRALKENGIEVEHGVLENVAQQLNSPYLKLIETKMPWVIAKWAMTLDGAIATGSSDSKWISNVQSRRVVHELRSRVDAIVIGIGTAMADNPMLNARLDSGEPTCRTALRVVVDRSGRLPVDSKLVQSAKQFPTMVAVSPERSDEVHLQDLRNAGCELLEIPKDQANTSLEFVLRELGRRQLTNILIEGGSKLLGSAFDEGLVDEVHCFVAPILVGGATALRPIGGVGHANMSEASKLTNVQSKWLDGDIYIHGRVPIKSRT
ncbi:MAG: bifunctional diaminohydroxyphosphoribosylaminopyrimidine deaminase/5-amino-6-(5-phosphoribosylamino)uracil reductase RibD [Pirellula sp.]